MGDVKQSIYKFRLAEPEIFQKKYAAYKKGGPYSHVTDLNKNFRSKTPVINFINDVFEEIMDGYDENARLYPGDPDAEKVPVSAGDADADRATAQPCLYLAQAPWKEDSQIDDELKNIMKAEKEAMAAARCAVSGTTGTFTIGCLPRTICLLTLMIMTDILIPWR